MTSRQDIECPMCGEQIELKALHVEPGDTVVFTYNDTLRAEYAETLRGQLQGFFGPGVKALVVTRGTLRKESP